jgi:hypothetical protein
MTEAYAVSVRVSLINAVSAGLLGMTRQFKTAGVEAAVLQRRLDGIKRSLLVGGLQIGVGVGLLAMFKPALDQAKQFQQLATQFSTYGMGDAANREAVKFAKSMNIMGASYVDAMKLIYESQGVFRESGALSLAQQFEGAKIASPILAKLSFIERGLSGDERSSRHAQDLAMLRFVEARGGANDPRAFAGIADWGFKLSKSSGGIVDWSQLQQMTATAGPMTRTLTQDAFSKLEPVIGDLKGGRVGSGLRVAFQRLLGTQRGLPKQAIQEYLKLGLWDPSKVELNKSGGIKQFLGTPGQVFKGRLDFLSDPVKFFEGTFFPAIAKKYGNQILGNTPEAIAERSVEESMVFGPGTASAVFSQIDKLMPAISRSLAAQNKQFGIDAAYRATGGTLAGKQVDMAAKFKSLLEQTGEVVLPLAVKGLEMLLPPLTWISNWAQRHPNVFGGIIDGIVLLGGALVTSGVINGLSGLLNLAKLIGPIVSSAAVLNTASWLTKIPLIGAALGGAGLDVGIFLGAITAPAWVAIAAIGVAVGAAGLAIYQGWKHWDASKSVFANLKAEVGGFLSWASDRVRDHKTGKAVAGAGAGGLGAAWLNSPLNAALVQWRMDFEKGFSQAFAPSLAKWKDFSKQLNGVGNDLKSGIGAVIAWLADKIAFVRSLIPGAGAAKPAPHPAAKSGAQWVWWTAKDYGAALGSLANTKLLGPLTTLSAVTATLHHGTTDLSAQTAKLTASHKALATAETNMAAAISTAAAKLAAPPAAKPVMPPARGQPIIIHHTTKLDGRPIAMNTSRYIADALAGHNIGNARFDHNTGLAAAGAGYHQ